MGIDESRSKNRQTSQQRSTRRLSFRTLLCEHLERREVMDAAGLFDAGTDPAYFQSMSDLLRGLNSGAGGGGNQGGNNGGGNNILGGAGGASGGGNINLSGNRWINPVGGSSPNNGDPASVSWSIVPDGTQVSTINGGLAPSNFISFMDGIYGASPGPVANRPWFNLVRRTYENWASVSGLNFIYEPNDDGAAYGAASRGRDRCAR